jgi:hypothetical protein
VDGDLSPELQSLVGQMDDRNWQNFRVLFSRVQQLQNCCFVPITGDNLLLVNGVCYTLGSDGVQLFITGLGSIDLASQHVDDLDEMYIPPSRKPCGSFRIAGNGRFQSFMRPMTARGISLQLSSAARLQPPGETALCKPNLLWSLSNARAVQKVVWYYFATMLLLCCNQLPWS